MINWSAFCIVSALLLAGCATKNDSGVVLYKKPDLSKVALGTPVSKVAGLKKPIKREVITKGELKGADAWLYEWDAPGDEVNNKMFTSVVVKDGVITGFYEETPDKWRKDPEMLKQAKLQSAFEDLASSMAQAAQYQAAAGYLAGYGAQMANRASSAPMQAYNNAYASSYKPWETAPSTANYGMVGGGPIARISPTGNIFTGSGANAGRISPTGQIFDASGANVGRVSSTGNVFGPTGANIGRVSSTGNIFNASGANAGRISPTGQIFDATGANIGRISPTGNIYSQ